MRKTFIALALVAGLCSSAWAQQIDKVSPHLAGLAKNETKSPKGGGSVTALATLAIPCDAGTFFGRHGGRLIDSIGRIYIVDIPLRAVAPLADNDTLGRLEAERMPRPAMDVTPGQVNATGI